MLVALLGLLAAVVLAVLGYPLVAGLALLGALGVVTLLHLHRRLDRSERDGRRRAEAERAAADRREAGVRQGLGELGTRVGDLGTRLGSLDDRVSGVAAVVATQERQDERVLAAIDALAADLVVVKRGLAELRLQEAVVPGARVGGGAHDGPHPERG
ncbi:hypothetical protein [Jannaschia sp. R86511]|uniref:hypothetical protein n=1 Tax=Jannaschia sp. R86511 TaxID=3093853 RepID=UPI0036D3C3B7